MNRSEILDILRNYKKKNQDRYRFTKIGIFGSVAKGSSGEKSDIDIVVEQKEPDLFLLGCIKTDLEEEFGKKIDIVRFREIWNGESSKRFELGPSFMTEHPTSMESNLVSPCQLS